MLVQPICDEAEHTDQAVNFQPYIQMKSHVSSWVEDFAWLTIYKKQRCFKLSDQTHIMMDVYPSRYCAGRIYASLC
jgi:hypothetical protein